MKVLFVINSLEIGGGEKSLVSLLNCIDYNKYSVDLMMLKKGGAFEKYLPNSIKILDAPSYYRYLQGEQNFGLSKEIKFKFSKIKSSLGLRLNGKFGKGKNNQQIFYSNQKNILDSLEKEYDVAVAYAQGFPTYFVADKVKATKKIAWINCDYYNTMYDKEYDKSFYDRYDKVVAVSNAGKKSILSVFKDYDNKIEVIKDIVNPNLINEMAKENLKDNFDKEYINILTVARLVITYKGLDLLVGTARLLKLQGIKFRWYLVGDGPDRAKIEFMIEKNELKEQVILLGEKANPYKYMKKCDIYVQTSRAEGFGLTVCEAKILKKKIVCTNFETAKEFIKINYDGIIVEKNSKAIYEAIMKYIYVKNVSQVIEENLKEEELYNSINEYEKVDKILNI